MTCTLELSTMNCHALLNNSLFWDTRFYHLSDNKLIYAFPEAAEWHKISCTHLQTSIYACTCHKHIYTACIPTQIYAYFTSRKVCTYNTIQFHINNKHWCDIQAYEKTECQLCMLSTVFKQCLQVVFVCLFEHLTIHIIFHLYGVISRWTVLREKLFFTS